MAKNDIGGVWRTIGGRRVFIKDGQDLASAMKESGKFKLSKKQIDAGNKLNEKSITNAQNDIKQYLGGDKDNWDSDEDFVRELANEYNLDKEEANNLFKNVSEKEKQNKMGTTEYLMQKQREKDNFKDEKYNELQSKANEVAKGLKEQNKIETISKEEYDKMPNDYKGTLKELVDTAEFRGENKQELIKQYEKMGYDVDKDKTILKRTEKGTTLTPVKIEDNNNWQEQIKQNNAKMEKDVTDLQNKINDYRNRSINAKDGLERYQLLKEADNLTNQYYERFRENERANAKIKVESPNEKYMNVEAYAGYKDKFNETWGKDGSNDKVVSAKMYTNDEFMEHLEDANWHSERKQLLDANLTNQELKYIKDRTKVSAWGVENLTGKEQVDKLIKEAKSQNNSISNSLRQKAYQKYLKEHPASKLTFEQFKDMNSK